MRGRGFGSVNSRILVNNVRDRLISILFIYNISVIGWDLIDNIIEITIDIATLDKYVNYV